MKQRHRKHRFPPALLKAVNSFAYQVQSDTLQVGGRVSFANSAAHKALMKAIRDYAERPVDPETKPA